MCKKLLAVAALLALSAGTAQAIVAPIAVPNGDFEDYLAVGTDPGLWGGESGGIPSIEVEFGTNDEVWTNPSNFGSGWQSNGPQPANGKDGLQCPHASNHHLRIGAPEAIDNVLAGSFSGHLIGFMNLTEADANGASAGQVQSGVVGTLEEGSYKLTVAVGARPSGSWNDVTYSICLVADPVVGPNDLGSSGGTVPGTPASVTLVPSTSVVGSSNQDLVYILDVAAEDPLLGAPIAIRIDLANAGTQNGVETTLSTFTQANYDNVRLCVERKPNVVWVSFHGADDAPHAEAVSAGFTEAPDKGYTDLLTANGYDVTRYVTTSTPDPAVLEAADLVIVSRSGPSPDYQNNGATAWNSLNVPIIHMHGYTLRNSRLGFTTGATMPDTTGEVNLKVNDPAHPIFAGIELDANDITVNPYATLVDFMGLPQRGISVNTDPIVEGGTVLATVATAGDGAEGGMIIGEFPAGTTLIHAGGAGTDVLAAPRLVFLSGSRDEDATIPDQGAGIFDLIGDGPQLFLNAVEYMLPCYPCAPDTTNLLAQYLFEDGAARDTSGNGLDGVLVGSAAIVDVAGGKVLQLDGVDNDANSAFVDLPDSNDLLDFSVSGNATVAAWVLMDVSKNHNAIFSQGEWRDGLSLTIKGDTNPADQLWTGKDQSSPTPDDTLRSDVGIPVGVWTHVALTLDYDADADVTNVVLYLNGVPTGLAQGNGTIVGKVIAPVAGASRIGMEDRDGDGAVDADGDGSGRWVWDGLIDNVHIYGVALSRSEICYLASEAPGDLPAPEPSVLENGSFEEPAEPQVGFDNVPGWSTAAPVANSGIEANANTTDGTQVAYLGGGDPAVRQVSSLVIEAGVPIELRLDASGTAGAMLQMTLYADVFGTAVSIGTQTVAVTDTMTEYVLSVADASVFAGMPLGVELSNTAADTAVIVDSVILQ
ncbi:MAG: hypothetical protein JW993_13205 [Sedimentisphaerales bacterium]|nr:hypothetical protein [Sedimentisphaerales bacterium]